MATLHLRPLLRNRPARLVRGICLGSALALGLAQLSGCVVAPRGGGYGGSRPASRPAPPMAQAPAQAQAPVGVTVYFYPERGQPEALQERDRYACYRWAVRESGTDPGMTPVREVRYEADPPPTERRDGRAPGVGPVVGAVAGAAVGAAVSSPRHAAEHAVIGAVFGAVLGAAAEAQDNDRRAAEARRSVRWQPVADPAADNFRRAMSACMQGRGYRVG